MIDGGFDKVYLEICEDLMELGKLAHRIVSRFKTVLSYGRKVLIMQTKGTEMTKVEL